MLFIPSKVYWLKTKHRFRNHSHKLLLKLPVTKQLVKNTNSRVLLLYILIQGLEGSSRVTLWILQFLFLSLFSHLKKRSSAQSHLEMRRCAGIGTFQSPEPHGCFLGSRWMFGFLGSDRTMLFPVVSWWAIHYKSEAHSLLGRSWSMEVGGKSQVWGQLLRRKEKKSLRWSCLQFPLQWFLRRRLEDLALENP